MTVKFNGIEDLTVPAGTYRVFRIDMTSNNVQMRLNLPSMNSSIVPSDLTVNTEISAQIYLEYGSMRQIKSTMEQTSTMQSSTLNLTTHTTNVMILTEHIKP